MKHSKQRYREGTRKARFLRIRDAILARSEMMTPFDGHFRQLAVGSFLIVYGPPGASGVGRGYNLQIWPDAVARWGVIMHGNKVANVDWDQFDNVEILSFGKGDWDDQLLQLLNAPGNVAFMPGRPPW